MKPDRKSGGRKGLMQVLQAVVLACLSLSAAGAAEAQSAYACRSLDSNPSLPAVEGRGGFFFSILPELQSHHGMGQETVIALAALSEALASRGTTLVLLPLPTRAQIMTDALPLMAGHVGYSADNANAVHDEMVGRIRAAGVTVADASTTLRRAARTGEAPFLKTDPRPSPLGVRLLAQSVAAALAQHPAMADVRRGTFSMAAGEVVTLSSSMHAQLQLACQSALPTLDVQSHGIATPAGLAINTASTAVDQLVVLGSDVTATPALNLAGFLAEATGLNAQGYGVPGGGAYAAMNTYLTSKDFATVPPRVLVWEWPVTSSMALSGPQPMGELIAAAGANCAAPLAAQIQGGALSAALTDVSSKATLALDLGAAAQFARFHFTAKDGTQRTRSIYRHAKQLRTGVFYLPLSDLAPEDMARVTIEADIAAGPAPRLRVCF